MRHLALLAAAYLLIVALVLPTSLSASEEQPPPGPAEAVEPAPEATPPPEAAPVPAPAPAPAPEPAAPAPQPEDLGVDNGPEQLASAAASTTVTIKDFEFSPAQITVNVGDTVTWNNAGPTAHSATASGGSFDTGIFGKGQSRSHTFNDAGTFAYICTPHPFMKGTVTVEAAGTGGGGGGGDADGSGTNARGGSSGGSGSTTSSTGSDTGSGSSLPATGSETARLLAFGLLMLALGVAVRRRASAG